MNIAIYNELSRAAKYYSIIEDVYRARAYAAAAGVVLGLKFDIAGRGGLRALTDYINSDSGRAIGVSIYEKIVEFVKTGGIAEFAELERAANIPALEILETVPGIGPVTARELVLKKIYNIETLRARVRSGAIKLTSAQLLGLKYYEDTREKIPRAVVEKLFATIVDALRAAQVANGYKFMLTGSYRRGARESGDVDIVAYSNTSRDYDASILNKIYAIVSALPEFIGVINLGTTRLIFLYRGPGGRVRQIDIYNADGADLVPYLLYSTGSAAHNEYLRGLCKRAGYKLNQYGLFRGDRKISLSRESDVYDILGIEYVPPDARG